MAELKANGFQINDATIFTVKDAASGELWASGIAACEVVENCARISFKGRIIVCEITERNFEPSLVGEFAGQTRYTWSGPVVNVLTQEGGGNG